MTYKQFPVVVKLCWQCRDIIGEYYNYNDGYIRDKADHPTRPQCDMCGARRSNGLVKVKLLSLKRKAIAA